MNFGIVIRLSTQGETKSCKLERILMEVKYNCCFFNSMSLNCLICFSKGGHLFLLMNGFHFQPKLKDKENKDSHPLNVEVKKERRPSLRRHSQEDPQEIVDLKPEALVPAVLDSEDTHSSSECPRKLVS